MNGDEPGDGGYVASRRPTPLTLGYTKRWTMSDEFKFDLRAKRIRLTDDDLVSALTDAAKAFEGAYFSSPRYDALPGERPHSATIIERFGSWMKALALVGVHGGRVRLHSPEQLIANLEAVWRRLAEVYKL